MHLIFKMPITSLSLSDFYLWYLSFILVFKNKTNCIIVATILFLYNIIINVF